MDNADDWKQKYFLSLEKLEQLEHKTRSWEDLENLLRLAMSRVAVAAQGVDPVLDKHLQSLRNSVRSGDYPALEDIIEKISTTVKRLDEQRQHNPSSASTAPQLLLNLLEQLKFPKRYKKRLKALRKSIQALDDSDPVDTVLHDFVGLLNETIHSNAGPATQVGDDSRDETRDETRDDSGNETRGNSGEDSDDKKGFFGRWFGAQAASSDNQAALRSDQGAPFLQGSETISGAATTDMAETPLAQSTPPSRPAPTQPADDSTGSAPQSKRYRSIQWGDSEQNIIANFCLRLLEALNFPASLQEHVQTLRDLLTEGFDMVETGSIIQKIADLITATRVQVEKEKRELQDFLHHLTGHLQDIDHQLSGAETSRRAHQQHNLLLNTAVQEQVNYIESTVNEASEMSQLKSSIQQHLLTIRRHFEEHRQLEEQQQQQLEDALARSNARLHALENESQQLRQRLNQEHQQAIHDSLTGVFNRLAYEERIEQEFARWKRYQQPLVMLIFDIDHFKKINDTYGHKAGDKALKLIAKTLQKNLRESDFLARFGGEEFIVLMPQTELEAALGAAEKLRDAVLANQFHYQQKRVHITISCGATQFKEDDNVDTAFQRADQALYNAKQHGRNRCEGC
ncbi:MAG: GGDEF domain-containing protein [Gammaproteobacteria bacterium]|nr:GGDEF domain-containing protein [Gammaproteobacteria bacterium]